MTNFSPEVLNQEVSSQKSNSENSFNTNDSTANSMTPKEAARESFVHDAYDNDSQLNIAKVNVERDSRDKKNLDAKDSAMNNPEHDKSLESLSTRDLMERINLLSMKPSAIGYIDSQGMHKKIVLSEDVDLNKLRINGEKVDLLDRKKFQVSWGGFDAKKAGANKEGYKEAYKELIKRADNPINADGEIVSIDQLKEAVEERIKSLEQGVDYTQEGKDETDASGKVSTSFPKLDDNRRVELHMEVVSALKTLTDPASVRMEYAMRMETLGDREEASESYQDASKHLDKVPVKLINKAEDLLQVDKDRLGESTVKPFGMETIKAEAMLDQLDFVVDGIESVEDTVIDNSSNGLDGKTYFVDSRKYGVPDLRTLYGLDDLHSAVTKRSAMFHLAPKFEQTKSWLGTLKFVDSNGEAVNKESLPAKTPLVPHGMWTFGNSDAYKQESERNEQAIELVRSKKMPYREARLQILKDQFETLKMVEKFEKTRGKTPRDAEEGLIYRATIGTVDAKITDRLP